MSATSFGLVGHPPDGSVLPFLHRALMDLAGISDTYQIIDPPAGTPMREMMPQLENLAGYTCGEIYQESIIPHLTELDSSARICGAVNTVCQKKGYNTEYLALIKTCPDLAGHRILLLGAGRISRIMAFAAAAAKAELWILARRPEQARQLADDVQKSYQDCKIHCPDDLDEWLAAIKSEPPAGSSKPDGFCPWALLNGTPVGSWPHLSDLPIPAEYLSHFCWIYDTIYYPAVSKLALAGRSRGIPAWGGQGLLFNQALISQQIWHPEITFSDAGLAAVYRKLSRALLERFPQTLILNGFMGSGKTTIGEALAANLGLPLTDLDQAIEKESGRSIPEIFAASGEAFFRDLERRILAQVLQNGHSQILSVGGGALIDPAAEKIVRNAPALVIYLDTPLEKIMEWVGDGAGRPLLHQKDPGHLEELYLKRQPRYQEMADFRVSGAGLPAQVAASIAAGLDMNGG